MNEIALAAGIMLGISGFFGVVLAVAARFLHVDEDPRIEAVEAKLPGTNCGACGEPGCHAFAETLVTGGASPGGCTVSPSEAVEEIARFLGVEAGFQERRVARLHCAGGKHSVRQIADYQGLTTCRAAFVVNGGGRSCPWGCLGLGDCDRACTFDAIAMNDESLPVVDVEGCTACGDCVEVCPLDLFTLEPISTKLIVQCRCPLSGDLARSVCRVVCDACGRCALDAPEGTITMTDGLPVVLDLSRTSADCTRRCPTGAIRWVEKGQFESESADA